MIMEKLRITSRFNEFRLSQYLEKIVSSKIGTFPISKENDSNVIIVSQVHKKAVNMAVIALKSFIHNTHFNNIHIIDDGSLTATDHTMLHSHFNNLTIIPITSIDTGPCPTGGTWERLIYISKLVKTHYVIQVDSDVLTLSPIFEINNAVANNVPFIIGDGPIWNAKIPLDLMSKIANSWNSEHIQGITESHFDKITSPRLKKYIRGCSGFCGFAQNAELEDFIHDISKQLSHLVGAENWKRWGTEQVTSNLAISSYEDQILLPWPKYQNYGFPFYSNDINDFNGKVSVIHFIGSNRHKTNLYRKLINKFIEEIQNN